MLRRLLPLLAATLVAAPAAAGDGPVSLAQQGGDGVLSPDRTTRYVALAAGDARWTLLTTTSTSSGRIGLTTQLLGSWGLPTLNGNGPGISLSADGRRLVLAETAQGAPSKFLVYDPRTMRYTNGILLNGDYTFDALSPDGSRLYLVQHTSLQDQSRYVVRAYDLEHDRLLPGRIADRTQKNWVMQGYPITRATSGDGRMVYTLYQNPGGYPFVHALDTVAGVAHCVGLPLSNDKLYDVTLAVHGSHVDVGGRYEIDTTTWRLSRPQAGFPWWTLLLLLAALPLAYALQRVAQRGKLRDVLRPVARLFHTDEVAQRRDEHRDTEVELGRVAAQILVATRSRRREDEVERPRVGV